MGTSIEYKGFTREKPLRLSPSEPKPLGTAGALASRLSRLKPKGTEKTESRTSFFPPFPPVNCSLCPCQRFAPARRVIPSAARQIKVPSFDERGDFAVGNRAPLRLSASLSC